MVDTHTHGGAAARKDKDEALLANDSLVAEEAAAADKDAAAADAAVGKGKAAASTMGKDITKLAAVIFVAGVCVDFFPVFLGFFGYQYG